jgi:small subunit ribosomal protein S9
VWDYWFNEFAPRYEGLPGLAPLEVTISRPSGVEEAASLKRRALRTLVPQTPVQPRAPRRDGLGRARATGRRKTATAQVFVWEGQGHVLVNRVPLDQYFPDVLQRAALLKPLMVTGAVGAFDVAVQVRPGPMGAMGARGAHGICMHGIGAAKPAGRRPLPRRGSRTRTRSPRRPNARRTRRSPAAGARARRRPRRTRSRARCRTSTPPPTARS